jgi:transcriptional regulator
MAAPFDRVTAADIADLIAAYPLAWVVSQAGEGSPAATPLPLLAVAGDDGRIVKLIGHFARRNPQVALLEREPRALLLFEGPHGYVSPSWISDRTWAPTWNYAVIRIEADIRFDPELTDRALEDLVRRMEAGRPHAWSIADMGARYARLRSGIVAFEAHVRRLDHEFKLGQDERPEVYAEILAQVGDPELVGWMQRMNPERS